MALICVLLLSGAITRPLNSTRLYATATATVTAAAALWKTLDIRSVMLPLLLLALSFAAEHIWEKK